MAGKKEMALYYNPGGSEASGNLSKAARLKGVLVRMGVRIRNVSPEQTGQRIGYLAGLEGFEPEEGGIPPAVDEEILVFKNFTDRRLDELLLNLRRSGVPKVELKAVLTETNSGWTLEQLYRELKKERLAMEGAGSGGEPDLPGR